MRPSDAQQMTEVCRQPLMAVIQQRIPEHQEGRLIQGLGENVCNLQPSTNENRLRHTAEVLFMPIPNPELLVLGTLGSS